MYYIYGPRAFLLQHGETHPFSQRKAGQLLVGFRLIMVISNIIIIIIISSSSRSMVIVVLLLLVVVVAARRSPPAVRCVWRGTLAIQMGFAVHSIARIINKVYHNTTFMISSEVYYSNVCYHTALYIIVL